MAWSLTLVRVACGPWVDALVHVLRRVSLYLVDVQRLQLVDAVRYDDLELLQFLVVDPGCPLGGGGFAEEAINTALETALRDNKLAFLRFIVAEGPTHPYMASAVGMLAARHGKVDALRWLVQHHYTACCDWMMEEAIQHGHLQMLQFLMETVAVQEEDQIQDLACLAAELGHQNVVKYLVQAFRLTVKHVEAVRHSAVQECHLRLVGWLDSVYDRLGSSASESLPSLMRDNNCLETLGKHRDVAELEWFVQQFPDCALDPKLLVYACESGVLRKVEFLVATLKLPRHHDALQDALCVACAHGHIDLAKLLLKHGASHHSLKLDDAVMNGHLAMVQFLQTECDVSTFHDFGKSFAHAVHHQHVGIVQWFDAQYNQPYPPEVLHQAARTGNIPMLQFLLSKPHEIKEYRTALENAFTGGQPQVARLLLEHIRAQGLEVTLGKEMISLRKELQAEQVWRKEQEQLDWRRETTRSKLLVYHDLLSREPNCDLEGQDLRRLLNTAHMVSDYVPLVRWLDEHNAGGVDDILLTTAALSGSFNLTRFHVEQSRTRFAGVALNHAASFGHLRILKYLFVKSEREVAIANTLVELARSGHWRVIRFLCENQEIEPHFIQEAFVEAARSGQLQVVKCLLVHGASKNGCHVDVQEAFCRACCGSFVNVVMWLLNHQALQLDLPMALKTIEATAEQDGLYLEPMISLLRDQLNKTVVAGNSSH